MGHFPIIHAPPPFTHSGSQSLSLEFAPAVPMPPPGHDQVPGDALDERQEHLVPDRDEGDFPVGVGVLETRQVRLFETEVRDGWERLAPRSGTDHVAGDGGFSVRRRV